MAADSDASWIESVRRGDKSAFGFLIDRHRAPAIVFARRMLNSADAEDVVQEALLAAFLKLDTLREPHRFRSWLFGIVANLSRTRIRSNREGYFEDLYGGGWAVSGFGFDGTEPSAELVHETRELHALVVGALECLPIEQQQAVRLHYLEGLRLWEMAALTKTPAGTLKARLHHAREKLRSALASQLGDVRLDRTGGSSMIEVYVHDVVLRAPKEEEAKWLTMPWDNSKIGPARVILLKERDGTRVLPLWVGSTEGDAIAMALESLSTVRPTTFDLTTRLLEIGKVKIDKVAVTSLRVVFYCSISITADGQTYEVDARPSDAIVLALLAKAPIYVTPQTFEQAAYCVFTAGSEIAEMEEFQRKWPAPGGMADPADGEWRSFRTVPRAENSWIKPPAK